MSPEELGKRRVGCTLYFTINTSETEGGLFFFSCNDGIILAHGVKNCS